MEIRDPNGMQDADRIFQIPITDKNIFKTALWKYIKEIHCEEIESNEKEIEAAKKRDPINSFINLL